MINTLKELTRMKFFCNFKKAAYIAEEKETHLDPVRLYS